MAQSFDHLIGRGRALRRAAVLWSCNQHIAQNDLVAACHGSNTARGYQRRPHALIRYIMGQGVKSALARTFVEPVCDQSSEDVFPHRLGEAPVGLDRGQHSRRNRAPAWAPFMAGRPIEPAPDRGPTFGTGPNRKRP